MMKPVEYCFADCRLNTATRDLWLRGEPQRIEPRVLDFLVCLIERRDRVVSKAELIAHVWDGEILSDGVLARAASRARKAIGDTADGPSLIKTTHRVGYRFIGDIRIVDVPLAPRDEPKPSEPARPDSPAPTRPPPTASSASSAAHVSSRTLGRMPAIPVLGSAYPAAPAPIGFFALNEEVAAWMAALPALRGAQRLEMLLRLAWHLRQRDTQRALALADEADALLGAARDIDAMRARARLVLVRGEVKWLFGQLHVAMDMAQQAASVFDGCGDPVGECDAALLQAAIAGDRDDPAGLDASVHAVLVKAKALGDNERYPLLQLQLALAEAQQHPANAETKWALHIEHWLEACGPGVRAACHYVQATWAVGRGDNAQALRLTLAARDLQAMAGQLRNAAREAANIGAMFANLFDNEAALQWLTEALTLARATGWPLSLGACLAQTAAFVGIMLKRPAEAVGLLDEAQQLLAAFPGSRAALLALRYRGDVQLALGEHAQSLSTFEQLASLTRARRLVSLELQAMYGRARALSSLGRSLEARDAALEALSLAEAHGNDYYQYLVLETLAEIHRDHQGLPLEAVAEPSLVLHYLLRALAKQGTDNPLTVPAALLEAIATEYARLGDHASAYAYQVRSQASHAEAQSTEIKSRAIAMKIRHDTEQARADSEHHQALAAAHAERAEALAQTNATLARMGTIGQEITRHLEAGAIFEALERHVHSLLDASSLAVFLLDSSGTALELAFGMEAGVPLPTVRVALDDPLTNVARCARECREIYVEQMGYAAVGILGTLPSQSALFAPLSTGTRVLGVLTVQSPHVGAYGEREQLVLRSLSAYSAVALDNATVYHRLESARDALALTHAELLDKNRELQRTRRALERIGPAGLVSTSRGR
jgi:DNA-binding winged helix-turn-helix (wHTH) protein